MIVETPQSLVIMASGDGFLESTISGVTYIVLPPPNVRLAGLVWPGNSSRIADLSFTLAGELPPK